jgi:molecular chaperone DnaK
MAKIIGIDLGTSNSAAAVMEGGKPTIIPSAEGTTLGGKAFPSYVAFTKGAESQLLIGEPARRQAVSNPEGTLSTFKRKMGTDFKYKVHGKEYTPQQLSAFILQKVKRDAEGFLSDKVEKAVITVPAYFNDHQRQATKDAGTIAGLDVVRIINEPTAACLAYGIDKKGADEKIMVFDLGGGTLDVTIMDFGGGVFQVVSTSGDTQLGGTDMDKIILDHIATEFKNESGVDVRNDPMAAQRLKEAAEKAKIELSSTLETDINLPFITADASGPKHLTLKLTRAKLEQLVKPIVDRCKGPIDQALKDAKLTPNQVTKIILVGGPTRMPIIQKFVEDTVGRKVERGIDPMECVALGAAVQAAVLTGEVKDVLLLDVTPLSFGIETLGGVSTKLIDRNTTIPVRKSQIFSTAADNQPAVTVHVLQGERPLAKDNVSLGNFDLTGIPPAARGTPQIEVTFDIDANGILNVTAKDLATGKSHNITVSGSTKMSKDAVEKAVKEAEQFAEDDKKTKEKIEVRNEADSMVYSVENMLKEAGDKISADEKASIEKLVEASKEALKGEDLEKIKSTKDELLKGSHKLAEQMYKAAAEKQQGAASAASGAAGAAGADQATNGKGPDNVVDAEIVDEGKK